MPFETDLWPFVQAKFFRKVDGQRRVRLIVMHSMEFPEKGSTAEDCAKYFQDPRDEHGKPRPASAHLCIDNNSIVQSVLDNNIPAAAPGANSDGIHLELAGFAKQTEAEWLDDYGKDLLNNAADAAAQYCLKYDIPVKQLTNDELANGKTRGFVSHAQVSAVFKLSDHTDPGPGFPWQFFLTSVEQKRQQRLASLNQIADPATNAP
jgi:N-acetyl-anhydromuramyl-L-alanine amidase AmpD